MAELEFSIKWDDLKSDKQDEIAERVAQEMGIDLSLGETEDIKLVDDEIKAKLFPCDTWAIFSEGE